jgi:ATP-dependent DNA helicase RecQ
LAEPLEAPTSDPTPPEPARAEGQVFGGGLTIAQLRLLRALEAERAAIARRRRIAPRNVVSDATLAALAAGGPGGPLLADVEDRDAFLRVAARFKGEP